MRVNDIRGFDFGLGETADMLRDSVRGFTADKISPRADEIDRSNTFPRDLWPAVGHVPARRVAGTWQAGRARHHGRGGMGGRRARLSRALRRDGRNLARLRLG